MISYEQLYTRCQSQSSDSDASTLANFKIWLSDAIRKCYGVLNSEAFFATHTDATADGTSEYKLPFNCAKVHSLKVAIDDVEYLSVEFPGSYNAWIALTGSATTSSETSYPNYFYVKADTYEIYPASSTDSLVMTMRYQIAPKDLSADDHTTESIKTMVNGSTAVIGNTGTIFTASMVGRYFKINDDGEWYKIATFTSVTAITLAREYGGAAVTAGTADYTIGEMSYVPEQYQEIPIDYALYRYYLQKESTLAGSYKSIWEDNLQKLKETGGNLTTSGILQENIEIKNHNDYPTGLA